MVTFGNWYVVTDNETVACWPGTSLVNSTE